MSVIQCDSVSFQGIAYKLKCIHVLITQAPENCSLESRKTEILREITGGRHPESEPTSPTTVRRQSLRHSGPGAALEASDRTMGMGMEG
jgi:hypothetical protein